MLHIIIELQDFNSKNIAYKWQLRSFKIQTSILYHIIPFKMALLLIIKIYTAPGRKPKKKIHKK